VWTRLTHGFRAALARLGPFLGPDVREVVTEPPRAEGTALTLRGRHVVADRVLGGWLADRAVEAGGTTPGTTTSLL